MNTQANHPHAFGAPSAPAPGLMRSHYLIFLGGAYLGMVFQVAYAAWVVIALTTPGMDVRIPAGVFALGFPMTVTLVSGMWLTRRLRIICPWMDRALRPVGRQRHRS